MKTKEPTTKELLNLTQKDLMNMTERELRKAVSTLRSTSRKRYERLTKADLFKGGSKAAKELNRGGGLPPVKTLKTRAELVNEYKRYKKFLKSKTSTVGGARDHREKLRKALKKGAGVELETDTIFDNDEQLEIYSDILDDLEDSNLYEQYYKKYMETLTKTIEKNPDLTNEEIKEKVEKQVTEWYEAMKRDNGDYGVYTSNLV